MIGIFLDDERNSEDVTWVQYPDGIEWLIVRDYGSFVLHVFSIPVDQEYIISFDHDLQDFSEDGTEKTGYDCLKALVDVCIDNNQKIPVCFFHTQNPVGKQNMQSYYDNFLKYQGETK